MTATLAGMPYRAIRVQVFPYEPYKPDGDSLRGRALNPNLWQGNVERNAVNDSVQTRFESIDALETHFYGRHQNLRWGNAATQALLQHLDIPPVSDGRDRYAYVLTRSADVYGRAVSFWFSEKLGLTDGAEYAIDENLFKLMRHSVNYKLLAQGLVMPMLYENLPLPAQRLFAGAAQVARQKKRGLWPHDLTGTGFSVQSLEQLEQLVTHPKMARRIFRNGGVHGLGAFLLANPDPLHLISEMEPENGAHPPMRFLHDPDILRIDEDRNFVRLLVPPENLVFHEKALPNPVQPNDLSI